MKKITAFLITIVLIVSLTACDSGANDKEKDADISDIYEIETEVGAIHYPTKWKDQVRTESTDKGISFYGFSGDHEEQLLFTLEFGEGDGELVGTLNNTDVYVVEGKLSFDDSWLEDEKNEIIDMQEDINVIIDTDLKPVEVAIPTEEPVETYTIDSAVGELMFPVKWKDNIRTESTENSISFYGTVDGKDEQLLFTIEFGTSDGGKVCTVEGTDVYIVEGKLEFDKTWTDAERLELIDMQEAVNVIIDGLSEQDGYSPA